MCDQIMSLLTKNGNRKKNAFVKRVDFAALQIYTLAKFQVLTAVPVAARSKV